MSEALSTQPVPSWPLEPQPGAVVPPLADAAPSAAPSAAGAAERGRSPSAAEPAADGAAGPSPAAAAEDGQAFADLDPLPEAAAWPNLAGLARGPRRGRGRRLVPKDAPSPAPLTPQQRLLLLDTWQRSGLPA